MNSDMMSGVADGRDFGIGVYRGGLFPDSIKETVGEVVASSFSNSFALPRGKSWAIPLGRKGVPDNG